MHVHPLLRPGCQFLALLSAFGYWGALLGRPGRGADLRVLAALALTGTLGFRLGRIARSAR